MSRTLDLLWASLLGGVIAILLFIFARGTIVQASYAPVPVGIIGYFNAAACPSGWAELVAARGRYLVGMVSGATSGLTAGTAFTVTQEDRATGIHGHAGSTITINPHLHNGPFLAGFGAAAGAGTDIKVDAASTSSGASAAYQGIQNTTATGTVTVANSAGTAGTNAPYIQLLVCSKS